MPIHTHPFYMDGYKLLIKFKKYINKHAYMKQYDNMSIPHNLEKMVTSLAEVNTQMAELREMFTALEKKTKKLNHVIDMVVKKELKSTTKAKRERKPCGFAVSSKVTPEMCEFMGREEGSLISRIEITKYLNLYIKEQGLENPENKQNIVPDEKLWKILGEEARNEKITHFTIQKYLNKHFVK
jgi:chromatin remodeling complex protein RSC6